MKHFTLLLVFIACTILVSLGQGPLLLKGKVMDGNQQPVSTGDAFLLSAKDSSLLKYAPVEDGIFQFTIAAPGNYILKFSCSGFLEKALPLSVSGNTSFDVQLVQNTTEMKGVTVSGSKKFFTIKNGNPKFHIEHSPLSSIPDPVNLLSKLPSIQLGANGESISILGKGEPVIYIDNQKMTMNDLLSLAVNDIKTIEIIHNPSAKYEAEGRAVILIMRKPGHRDGLKVDLAQNAGFKRFYQHRTGTYLSYRKRKMEIKSNLQYNRLNLWESNANEFIISNKNIASKYRTISLGGRSQYIAGSGIYYQINEHDYYSANVTARIQKEPFTIRTNSSLRQGSSETHAQTSNFNKSPRVYFSSNLNYNKKFKGSNGTLFWGAQYAAFNRKLESSIWNSIDNGQPALSQDRMQHYGISVFTSKADYARPLKEDLNLEAGVSYSNAAANALLHIKSYGPTSNVASDYDYAETIYAAYTQLSGKHKLIAYTAGLRVENSGTVGQFKNNTALPLKKNFTQLFPKASLQLPIDSTKTLTLNYARTVKRPNYSATSQITTYINPFFEWSSNINLAPALTQELSASLQYKEHSLQLTYARQKAPIYYSTEYDEQAARLRMVDKNMQSQSGLDATLSVPLKYKRWSSVNSVTAGISKIKDPSAVFNELKPYLYLFTSNQVRLPKDYTLSVTAWGLTKRHEGIFERNALFAVDTSVTKTFDKKLSCTVSFNDIFRSLNSEERFTYNSIASNGIYYEDVREFSLALKYSFGSFKNPAYKNRDVDEHANRIK